MRRSNSFNDDALRPSVHHANRGSRLHGGNHYSASHHRTTVSHGPFFSSLVSYDLVNVDTNNIQQ